MSQPGHHYEKRYQGARLERCRNPRRSKGRRGSSRAGYHHPLGRGTVTVVTLWTRRCSGRSLRKHAWLSTSRHACRQVTDRDRPASSKSGTLEHELDDDRYRDMSLCHDGRGQRLEWRCNDGLHCTEDRSSLVGCEGLKPIEEGNLRCLQPSACLVEVEPFDAVDLGEGLNRA
jgi:hypothetical protein